MDGSALGEAPHTHTHTLTHTLGVDDSRQRPVVALCDAALIA